MAASPPNDLADIRDGTPLTDIAARYGVSVGAARRWVTTAWLPYGIAKSAGSPRDGNNRW